MHPIMISTILITFINSLATIKIADIYFGNVVRVKNNQVSKREKIIFNVTTSLWLPVLFFPFYFYAIPPLSNIPYDITNGLLLYGLFCFIQSMYRLITKKWKFDDWP